MISGARTDEALPATDHLVYRCQGAPHENRARDHHTQRQVTLKDQQGPQPKNVRMEHQAQYFGDVRKQASTVTRL